jgi:hypothetical protein
MNSVAEPANKYDTAVRRRRYLFRFIRGITLILYVSLLTTVSVQLLYPNYKSYTFRLLKLSHDEAAIRYLLFSIYSASLILVPLALSMLFTSPRKKIFILRPFGSSILSLSLRNFILRSLSGREYIYTLGDKTFGRSYLVTFLYFFLPILSLGRMTYSRISFLISPLIRDVTSLDDVMIWSDYNKIASNIDEWPTRGHSHYNSYSGGQALTIRCSQEKWRDCVGLFLINSDIVIVDLSLVKTGSQYEVEEIIRRRLVTKCLFVSIDLTAELAQRVIDRYLGRYENPCLHIFRGDGKIIDPESFERDIKQIVIGADRAGAAISNTAALDPTPKTNK